MTTSTTTRKLKRLTCKTDLKTGPHAQVIECLEASGQEQYHQLIRFYQEDSVPEDSIEADLLHQIAFNRIRFFRDQALEARAHRENAPLATLLQLQRTLDSLERSFLRLSNTFDTRRRKKPPVNTRSTCRSIDPRTGRMWRTSDDRKQPALASKPAPEPEPEPPPAQLPPEPAAATAIHFHHAPPFIPGDSAAGSGSVQPPLGSGPWPGPDLHP
jgi:hypothetical protein